MTHTPPTSTTATPRDDARTPEPSRPTFGEMLEEVIDLSVGVGVALMPRAPARHARDRPRRRPARDPAARAGGAGGRHRRRHRGAAVPAVTPPAASPAAHRGALARAAQQPCTSTNTSSFVLILCQPGPQLIALMVFVHGHRVTLPPLIRQPAPT